MALADMQNTTQSDLVPITPVKAVVNGYSAKFQVTLDEDSTNDEILRALREGCKEWSANVKTGAALMLEVGKILLAVKVREIFRQEPWGSMDRFLEAEVEERFGIVKRTAYDAILLAETFPNMDDKRARKIRTSNLVLVARAVKHAPPAKRSRLRRRLLDRAEETPVTEFREYLSKKSLRRVRAESALVGISVQVSRVVRDMLDKIAGDRSLSVVLSRMIADEYDRLFGKRKPQGKQIAIETENRASA